MSEVNRDRYTQVLQQRMQQLGISSFRQLSQRADVSEWQLRQLRQGKIEQMRLEFLLRVARTLQWSIDDLIAHFSDSGRTFAAQSHAGTIKALQQEYQRLQHQLQQQRDQLIQEFEESSLQLLESWMVQWSAAAAAAENNPTLPAARLLPLMKPIEQLLHQWGVEAIASVGEVVDYDPQWHQLMNGLAQPGAKVRVRYAGYLHHGKLLYRAKVSLVE
jgi:DNA-binding Xre family transcriptional regulator